jgi:hypothetical protein
MGELAVAYAQPKLQMGGSNTAVQSFVQHIPPSRSWRFCGTADVTDAPNEGYTNTQNNLSPRDNVVDMAQHGYFTVKNNSTTASITVSYSLGVTMAYAVRLDDSTTTISELASAMYHQSEHLKQHMPPVGTENKSFVGGIVSKVSEELKSAGSWLLGKVKAGLTSAGHHIV